MNSDSVYNRTMADGPSECNIKVICRVRPLNESEEKAGSKFVLKFPTDDSISIGVSYRFCKIHFIHIINLSSYNFSVITKWLGNRQPDFKSQILGDRCGMKIRPAW